MLALSTKPNLSIMPNKIILPLFLTIALTAITACQPGQYIIRYRNSLVLYTSDDGEAFTLKAKDFK